MKRHFPEMEMEYVSVEYSDAFGDYLISFRDKNGAIYSCVIGPEFFPISLGQGLAAVRGSYELWYSGPTPVIVDICDYAQKNGLECTDKEELFFEDEQSEYYFSEIKSPHVIVTYSHGYTESIVTALKTRRITIADLDRFGIEYYTKSKE